MNLIETIKEAFNQYLKQTFSIDDQTINLCSCDINIDPSKADFGDINANCAMILAKILGKNPRELATQISQNFTHKAVEKIEVAGPGFLNLFLTDNAYKAIVQEIVKQGISFFRSEFINKKNYNIEFVSANPTGPLHFGHGRGGIIGDVLGNVLKFLGHDVTKEFYINDAGTQIKKLGASFKIRCQQEVGQDVQLSEDAYHGDYLIPLAKALLQEKGKTVLEKPDSFFEDFAKEKMLEAIKKTVAAYGIHFDVWSSEKSLHDENRVHKAIAILEKKGLLFEKDGATWFKSTEFGDDKDRVLIKSTGEYTYVSSDIAYLEHKAERGFNHLIMTLGHDHHSYAVRLEGLRQALGINVPLDIILYQLVKVKSEGEQVRMSKRAGKIVSLDDIIETVGKDVARFFYLHRKADAQLEFDVNLALKRTEENPVYYIQYAYVRTKSILEKARLEDFLGNITEADAVYIETSEQILIKKIISLKEVLGTIQNSLQSHILTYYVIELANSFHSYYSKNRVIDAQNPERSRSRLLLIRELKQTFELCLDLLGLSKPEKM